MEVRGTFQCALCEEREHKRREREAPISFIPRRTISLCEECYHEFRTNPAYADLRPSLKAEEIEDVKKKREYQRDTHIYF